MTATPAISSLPTAETAAPRHAPHRRIDGFDRQLQSTTAGQMAQSAAGAAAGAGSLLSSDLLQQLQSLSGLAAATPAG